MKTLYNNRDRESEPVAPDNAPDLEITAEEAQDLLRGDSRAILIDVRSEGEMCLGHIKGAQFIPPRNVEEEVATVVPEKDLPILVYCSSGPRSLRAVERLRGLGYGKARSIAGGYDAWLKDGREVVNDGAFTPHQLDRYSRNMLLREIGEEGQMKLLQAGQKVAESRCRDKSNQCHHRHCEFADNYTAPHPAQSTLPGKRAKGNGNRSLVIQDIAQS